MDTKHKKLRKVKANKDYYSKSDGNFMTLEQSLYSHKHLDRVAWARDWVHELSSRNHIDIGCKDGYLCLTLSAEGVECVGIDPSEDAIDEAQLKALEAKLDITFLVGFAEEVPDKIKADTVTCLEVIEHVVDPDILLKKLSKMGVYVMISTPDTDGKHGIKDAERNFEHLRLYSKDELKKLVSKYGRIMECVVRDGQICLIFQPK